MTCLSDKQALTYLAVIEAEAAELQEVIVELHARGEHPVRDGYPTGGTNARSSGAADPTCTYVLATMNRAVNDPVGRSIGELDYLIIEIAKRSQRMRQIRSAVFAVESQERGRQNSIPDCANPSCAIAMPEGPRGAGRCRDCYRYRIEDPQNRDRRVKKKSA